MKVVLIRHYRTPGNSLGKYIGVTDEDLEVLSQKPDITKYPRVDKIYASPLKRCIQTAELLYPGQSVVLKEGLRECDFGKFENKNYQELASAPEYQKWIDSGGKMKFPEGEEPEDFKRRSKKAFLEGIEEGIAAGVNSVAFVVHGGTIMSIMEAYDSKQNTFYDYQVKNGEGYLLTLDEETWENGNGKVYCERELKN